MPLPQGQELAQFFTNKSKEWEDKEELPLRASGFFTRMMLVRVFGGLFSSLLRLYQLHQLLVFHHHLSPQKSWWRCRLQVSSPTSVLIVSTALRPSESHEDGF